MNFRNLNLRLGNTPLTIGLIFGIILALVSILFTLASVYLGQLGSYLSLAIFILFGLLAGRRASLITGKISSALLAGFLTGFIGTLLVGILSFILNYINIDYIRQQYQLNANKQHPVIQITNGMIIQSELTYLLISLVFYSLLALAGGSVGGYLGRRRAQLSPPEEYQEAMFVPPPSSNDDNLPPPSQVDDQQPYSPDDESQSLSQESDGPRSTNSLRRSIASRRSHNSRRNSISRRSRSDEN